MNAEERQVIDSLFDRLREAERQVGTRDPIADSLIRSRIEAQPAAPYYMAQTIVMQQQALQAAQARIAELEDQQDDPAAGGGGFLSSLFGGGQPQPSRRQQSDPDNLQGMMPPSVTSGLRFGAPGIAAQAGRGGFLAGAAQTAMGVAGGLFLGSMIASAFSGGEAGAAEVAEPEPASAADHDDALGGDFGADDI